MTNIQRNEYEKVKRVIMSCNTIEQSHVARRMLQLLCTKHVKEYRELGLPLEHMCKVF